MHSVYGGWKISDESFGETVSKERPPKIKLATVAVIVIAVIVGIPLLYYFGQSVGYVSGYNEGLLAGYISGCSEGREDWRFAFYYWKPEQKFGVDELRNELKDLEWKKPYEEGVF